MHASRPAGDRSPADPPPPSTPPRIDHLGVAVRDADAACGYWVGHLGLTVLHDERLPEIGVRLVYLDGGGTMLQLVQPVGPGAVADFVAANGEGLHHVCFAVPDIPQELARLPGEAGARVFRGGRDRRACFLLGRPNQVLVELTELAPSFATPTAGADPAQGGRA